MCPKSEKRYWYKQVKNGNLHNKFEHEPKELTDFEHKIIFLPVSWTQKGTSIV